MKRRPQLVGRVADELALCLERLAEPVGHLVEGDRDLLLLPARRSPRRARRAHRPRPGAPFSPAPAGDARASRRAPRRARDRAPAPPVRRRRPRARCGAPVRRRPRCSASPAQPRPVRPWSRIGTAVKRRSSPTGVAVPRSLARPCRRARMLFRAGRRRTSLRSPVRLSRRASRRAGPTTITRAPRSRPACSTTR